MLNDSLSCDPLCLSSSTSISSTSFSYLSYAAYGHAYGDESEMATVISSVIGNRMNLSESMKRTKRKMTLNLIVILLVDDASCSFSSSIAEAPLRDLDFDFDFGSDFGSGFDSEFVIVI